MSTFTVEVVKIQEIINHPNADKLDIISLKDKGWQCIVGKGAHKAGDLVVYIPIDSILPEAVENKLFANSKVKLSNHRVRTIKLRGAISQGMVASFEQLGVKPCSEGTDLTKTLGIVKYEPTERLTTRGGRRTSKKNSNPNFCKYTEIENYKNYPGGFEVGEMVIATEKIHGTNFRAGYVKSVADTWWKKVKLYFGKLPEYEFVFGSHNVQLHNGNPVSGEVACNNVYEKAVAKYRLKEILEPGEVIYGEIYGDGIQNNYNYGCKAGEFGLVVFDLMRDGVYQDTVALKLFCYLRELQMPPILYHGPFDLEVIKALTIGNSVLCPAQKVREGVVIKPEKDSIAYFGRKVLKLVSDEYLMLKDNSEFH